MHGSPMNRCVGGFKTGTFFFRSNPEICSCSDEEISNAKGYKGMDRRASDYYDMHRNTCLENIRWRRLLQGNLKQM